MATNQVYEVGDQLSVVCTAPATPSSGDPVLLGQLAGVALTDEATDGTTSVAFKGVFDVSVQAVNNTTGSAVAAGDVVYYDAAATPKINKDNVAGVRFGIALEAVTSGATATIQVRVGY
jgi:predicted RecA/RadA family phage recombinase